MLNVFRGLVLAEQRCERDRVKRSRNKGLSDWNEKKGEQASSSRNLSYQNQRNGSSSQLLDRK